jgi:hypothetical protein
LSQFRDHVDFFNELRKRSATSIVDRLVPLISMLTPDQKRSIFLKSFNVAVQEEDRILKLVACTIGYTIRLQENIERDSLEWEIKRDIERLVDDYLVYSGASNPDIKSKNLVLSSIFHPPFYSYGELPLSEMRGYAFLNTLHAINRDFIRFLNRNPQGKYICNKITRLQQNLENQNLHNQFEREHWRIFEEILDEICPPSRGDFFMQPGYTKYINPPLGKKLGYLLKTFKTSPLVRETVALVVSNIVRKNYILSRYHLRAITRSGLLNKLELRIVKNSSNPSL